MSANGDIERTLEREFAAQRAADRARVPDFAAMVARAKAQAESLPATETVHASPFDTAAPIATPTTAPRSPTRRWTSSPWTWAVPALAAASLAAVLFMPRGNADAEFESLVADWSRTAATLRTPTDGLLDLPGNQYLRAMPVFRSPALSLPSVEPSPDGSPPVDASRPPSPS